MKHVPASDDQAVDVGNQSMGAHIEMVCPAYGKRMTRAYLCGVLATITHWLIANCGSQVAYEILQEMADCAIKDKLPKGK
jgi:hypothetical protein